MNPIIEALFIGPTSIVALLVFANFNNVNIKANRWFGFFILSIFILQAEELFYNDRLPNRDQHIYDFIDLIRYVIAPVFYFSIVYYVEPNRKWKQVDYLHFIFALLMLLLTILSFFVPVSETKTPEEKALETKAVLIFTIVFCLQVLPYCVAAYYKINKYQKNLLAYASNTERVDLSWLKKVVVCVIIITALWLSDILFQLSEISAASDSIITVFYFLSVWYIAYHSLNQRELFTFSKEEKKEIEIIISETEARPETKKKLILDEKLGYYIQSLENFMDKEKPHLDPEISLIRMADQFKTSPHQLSYLINTGFEENFFQFVNRYRVEEAKRMMLDPAHNHLTLVGIAHEAGFNSKTVFNTTFRKITGKTPTEFKNEHK